ncbi:PAS domain-containing protein [Rufibacter tibetensis]|uniref:PAS domain-containing protein n=1 Tax=Rufibacter tibetensis TaxID=512763 RepID=UPI00146FFBDF|nr:PAS domain-containing protein [Rufibacter tibetensis]
MMSSTTSVSSLNLTPILQALPGLYLILSPDLIIMEATDAYLASTFKDRSIIGKYVFDIFPDNPDVPEAAGVLNLRQSLEHAISHKVPHKMNLQRYDVTRPQELGGGFEEKYWQPYNKPVLNAQGEVLYLLHHVVDVTQQQKAKKENERHAHQAQQNLERFELIAKATNDVIWDWDLADNTIWWNEGFQVTFGYKAEEIEHDINSWYGRIHPDDAERVVDGIHQVIDGAGTSWKDEYRFRKADGTYADILDRGTIARDSDGNPVRMIGAMLDITEKNRHAAELRASEQHVRALLEGIPEIAWVAQADGYIHYYNKAWYAYTGYTSPDQGWDKVVHPEDLDSTISLWTHALSTGQEYVNEARLKRASDGKYHWFTIRATPLKNQDGTITAWVGVDTNIQEQKEIQQRLRERDDYVQRMLSQSPVQFAVLKGADWVVDFATPQFKQLVGGRDTVGKPFRQALPELETQGFFDIIEKVYSTGELHVGTETPAYLDRKGAGELELGYFNFMYQPLLDEHGTVEGIIILIVEVTEQVRVQKEAAQLAQDLKISHERTLKVLDALPHMTFTARPDGYVDYYSQQWYDYLCTSQEELNKLGWEYFIHPDDLQVTQNKWNHSLATGETYVIENRWRTKQSEVYRWFLVRAIAVRNEEGNIYMWVGSHTDIQDQKQMLLDLQESTQNFQFLADSMPQLVWTTDANGSHEYFNKKWVEFTGYDVEASKGTEMWSNLLHPQDRQKAIETWQHCLRTGEPYEIEYRFQRASDGEWRWFLGRALPLRDQEGTIVKWFGTCTDIEDQKQDEERQEQANRELRSINEDLDSFVYTASHDLKLPIINMAGIFQELTKSATFHDPDAQLLIQMFNRSLKQINATISDLAEIVKVQKEIDAHQEEIDLTDLVDEVKLSIQDLIQSSGARIMADFTQAPSLVYSRVNLKSIFYNLISNAVKYRSPDRAPEVRLHTYQQQDYTVLTIQDNGLGMNLELHGPKIFQMFKRFHNHVEGSGLGLYILNRIVQKNGGRIELESQVDQGTTFTIYFKNNA